MVDFISILIATLLINHLWDFVGFSANVGGSAAGCYMLEVFL